MEYVKAVNKTYSVVKHSKKVANSKKKVPVAIEEKYETEFEVVEVKRSVDHKFSIKRVVTDVQVLQTMFEKISKSNNANLISDINKHKIPERLEEIAIVVTQYKDRKTDSLSTAELDNLAKEIECINEQTRALMLVNIISRHTIIKM